MTRVFVTGMSGTGTSTVIAGLVELGHGALDLDEPEWSRHNQNGDWVWREDRVQRPLGEDDHGPLFVSDCPTNQVRYYDRFDHIILLTAPRNVIVERIRSPPGTPRSLPCGNLA